MASSTIGARQLRYLRVRKHYLPIPYLLLGILEFFLYVLAVYVVAALHLRTLELPGPIIQELLAPAGFYGLVISCYTLAMGCYQAMMKEGYLSMVLRTLVSLFLLGSLTFYVLGPLFPRLILPEKMLFWVEIISLLMILPLRAVFVLGVDIAHVQRRIVILGCGKLAWQVLQDCDRDKKELGVNIIGCIPGSDEERKVPEDHIIPQPESWPAFVKDRGVAEILVALDERRSSNGGNLPLMQLLGCKLKGVEVIDIQRFYEREFSKLNIQFLNPSWMVFSNGFYLSRSRNILKRIFDLLVAAILLLVTWPLMLLTALAIWLESGRPIIYRQTRVGLNGETFTIYKFRSMCKDAEQEGGARWASKNDARITRVGQFIRNTRLDELPQLYNVLAGHMSFVGPRPERPEFVCELEKSVPYYGLRNRVKPGLMGWAQLKYPYGASVKDARHKLCYDLYYTKNHSTLMDLLILIQTVEVILLGKGVH